MNASEWNNRPEGVEPPTPWELESPSKFSARTDILDANGDLLFNETVPREMAALIVARINRLAEIEAASEPQQPTGESAP